MNKLKLLTASIWSAIVTVVYVFIITIAGENSPALTAWLKSFSGHHWISKSIFTAIIYVLFLGIFYAVVKPNPESPRKGLRVLVGLTVILGAGLVAYFIAHDLY